MSTPLIQSSPLLQALWRLGVAGSTFDRVMYARPEIRALLEDLANGLGRLPYSWEDSPTPRLAIDELLRAALLGWATGDDDVTRTERCFVLVSEVGVGLDEVIAHVADAPGGVHRLRRQARELEVALADEGWPSKVDDDFAHPVEWMDPPRSRGGP